jgi:succinate dehydrogenase/fumarate reductase flavoprotein subunit
VVTELLGTDVLVVGAGMAGLTAALRATELGQNVVVVEVAPQIGGSARISGAFLWTIPSREAFRRACPRGDQELGDLMVDQFETMTEWVRATGIHFSEMRPVTSGSGHQIDIVGYLNHAARRVEASGGAVILNAEVDSLVVEDNRVVGARVRDSSGIVEVRARGTVLATGGFQGSRARLQRYFGDASVSLWHRSNPYSVGDGLRLGLSVGAATTEVMDSFYGHLIASPVPEFVPSVFVRFARVFSSEGVLINLRGERFTQEWLGDHVNCQAAVGQPEGRALLVIDEETHQGAAKAPIAKGLDAYDTLEDSRDVGARIATALDVESIAHLVTEWGYDGRRIPAAVAEHGREASASGARPLASPPYHAMEVRPAITFTQGGLRIDTSARVLDESGQCIDGLFAAGADAGGMHNGGYAGGLSMSAVLGLRAAESIVADRLATA